MPDFDTTIKALRDALAVSPDNSPLRLHLCSTLMQAGKYFDAEHEYRDALRRDTGNVDLKVGLAKAFYEQRKNSEAMVVIEDLIKLKQADAAAYMLYARLSLRNGDIDGARDAYTTGVEMDQSVADESFADQIGVEVVPQQPDMFDDDDDEDDDDEMSMFGIPLPRQDQRNKAEAELERPEIKFEDVGGMDTVKEQVNLKIIQPMLNPEIYEAYGQKIGGGILMYGPPGCGKTFLARATAGEVDARFMVVGISDVLDMYMGMSENNLHELFEQARSHTPCVMFFDEVDALGASRTDMRQSSGRQLINQFLSELDGAQASNDGVLILAATNAPWHLDSAFRRPGRFDRIIFVPPPDAPARAQIVQIMLKGKPAKDIDYDFVAKKTEGFSGADLKAVIDTAVEEKLKDAMKTGVPQPLVTKDLTRAAKKLRPTTKEWFATARNHALYANQGGIYDDIIDYMKLL